MFGKKERKKFEDKKGKWNIFTICFFVFLLVMTCILVLFVIGFSAAYEDYQNEYISSVKNGVIDILDNSSEDDISNNLILLNNEYNFEVIVTDNETIVFTSNNIYDINYAQDVFDNDFYFSEVFQYDNYLIWIVIPNVDNYIFFNDFTMKAMFIVIIIIITIILFQSYILSRISKPLKRLHALILALKTKKDIDDIELRENVDVISLELMGIANDMSLELYKSQNYGKEYQRRFNESKNLIEEQKDYLTAVVHSMKNPLNVIEFAKYILEQKQDLNESEMESLESISKAAESLLNLVDTTLANVSDENSSIYSETTDVNLQSLIVNYMETNNLLLRQKSLIYSVIGESEIININFLKISQLIENIISNMIVHAKEHTELLIEFQGNEIHFINVHGDDSITRGKGKDFSKGYGVYRIKQLSLEMDIDIAFYNQDGEFKVILYMGE